MRAHDRTLFRFPRGAFSPTVTVMQADVSVTSPPFGCHHIPASTVPGTPDLGLGAPPAGGLPAGLLAVPAAPAGSGQLRGLIMQKEKELHDINEYRIHTLETLLQEKERDISESKGKLTKLKDDFNYNLRLLEERDTELERYDSSFSNLKAVIRDRDIELSELKVSAAELQHGVKQERDRQAESESYYQQKLQQQQHQL